MKNRCDSEQYNNSIEGLKETIKTLEKLLEEKRQHPKSVWVLRYKENGKTKTLLSWDGPISSAYVQYVPFYKQGEE